MDEEIPEFYAVESIEQMRAIADELRLRITEALGRQAMTVTQLGALLGQAPAKIHYHVRELERVGLVKLVATREKGGILEKYYRSVAKSINMMPDLFQYVPADTVTAAANDFLRIITQGYLRALGTAVAEQRIEGPDAVINTLVGGQAWMTGDEMLRALEQVKAIFQPYEAPRGLPGEHEVMVAHIVFEAQPTARGAASSGAPSDEERASTDGGTDETDG
jgi:DNA-binding transcriptional ArsR family regulator